MPKKSAASIAVIPVDVRLTRLKPPATLPAPERTVFLDIVGAHEPKHFRQCDVALLVNYCEAVVLGERAASELRHEAVIDGKLSPWVHVKEKCVRTITALSVRLRIGPQARREGVSEKSKNQAQMSYYERMELNDRDDGDR